MGGMLLCPAGQENLILGLRYGKAEAIGGRYGSLGKIGQERADSLYHNGMFALFVVGHKIWFI